MDTCVPADTLSPAALMALFNACYADYFVPLVLDQAGFAHITMLCDVDLAASRVRLADGVPIGLVLLAVRSPRGWIGGMGVRPAKRRAGHGRALMQAVLDEARQRELAHVQLEVLEQNAGARKLYESLGFAFTRRVNVWLRPAGAALPEASSSAPPTLRELPAPPLIERIAQRLTPRAPWQREVETLRHIEAELRAIEAVGPGGGEAFALYRVQDANVNLLEFGAEGASTPALTALLRELAERHAGGWMRVLNLPEGHAAEEALRGTGFAIHERQGEMKRALSPRT